jgi:hypothetical protein
LKALDLPTDTIFKHLQDYAGFNGEPKRQGAAWRFSPTSSIAATSSKIL